METEQHYLGDLIAERKGYFIYKTTVILDKCIADITDDDMNESQDDE